MRFIRSDFAGPGGVSEGLRLLGIEGEVGIELEEAPVATARAAGHIRWQVDVTSAAVRRYPWPSMWLYVATPPCQTFSTAGKGDGRRHLEHLIAALRLVAGGVMPEVAIKAQTDTKLDSRSVLSLEPMNVIRDHRPRNVMFEEVPGVLPLWNAYAEILRGWGYSVWTGVLSAEMYGVPQTRRRAILMASLDGPVAPPTPTHSRYYNRDPQRLDEGVLPWVSMAQALDIGGLVMRSNYGTGGDPAARGERTANQPAPAVTSKAGRNFWLGDDVRTNGTMRPSGAPAPTISGSLDNGNMRIVMQSEGGRRWDFNDQSGTPYDADWPEKRPATAVAGREIVQNPGATANRFNGSTKSRNDGVRVTVQEAAMLQSFRPDYPWVGTKTQQYQQVGDAVPPLLARAVLGALLGIPFDPALPVCR